MEKSIEIFKRTSIVKKYIWEYGDVDENLVTSVILTIKKRWYGGYTYKFEIYQPNILNPDPFYDKEFSNNRYLQSKMNIDRFEAEKWIKLNKQTYINKFKNGIID